MDKEIGDDEPAACMRIGSAVDAMLLSKNQSMVTVIDEAISKSTSKASMAAKSILKADCDARQGTWLTHSENEKVKRIVDACLRSSDVSGLLAQIHEPQHRVHWTCRWTGWVKRGTLDYKSATVIADLKTTQSWNIHPRRIHNHIANSGHHRQLAMYQEGVEAATGIKLPTKLIYAASDPPFDVVVIDVDGPELELGWLENERACRDLEQAWAYNSWRAEMPHRAEFPEWAFNGG